jgi:hypothetical protein
VGAAGCALWGGLIGLLFLAPLLGMAVGVASADRPTARPPDRLISRRLIRTESAAGLDSRTPYGYLTLYDHLTAYDAARTPARRGP